MKRYQSQISRLFYFIKKNSAISYIRNLKLYRVSQKWRTNYLLPYRGCLNVHEKNMENMFPTKKSIIFIIIINDNTM
jgi:hypothetical protein